MEIYPPHQSLTRQLPPKGKPSVRSANIASITLTSIALNSGMTAWFALIRRLRRHLPPRRGRLSEALLISKRVLRIFRIWILPFWASGIRISRFQSGNGRNPHNNLFPSRGRLSEALLISKRVLQSFRTWLLTFGLQAFGFQDFKVDTKQIRTIAFSFEGEGDAVGDG